MNQKTKQNKTKKHWLLGIFHVFIFGFTSAGWFDPTDMQSASITTGNVADFDAKKSHI